MRVQQFGLRRCRTGENGVRTRIQRLRHTLDAATFSSRIPAFIHDHHGYAPNVHFQLDTTKTFLFGFQLKLVLVVS